MSTVRLYLIKSIVSVAGVAPSVKAWHVLVGIRISILVLLGQEMLLLLGSSVGSRLLLLVHHEGCLRGLILVWIIEVGEVRSIVYVKRVLPILKSVLWGLLGLKLLLLLYLYRVIRRSCQIVYGLLLLLLLVLKRERIIYRAVYCRFRIFKVVRLLRKLLDLACFNHWWILSETSRLHKVWILVLLRGQVLSVL